MSGGIEEPYTIARLPSPLDGEHGCTLAAPVYSLSGSKKRKRHEVAVAVDGECISIYNVRNQTLSSSYPLPPQSYLAAPPCSIYCKRAKPLVSQRRTYFASRDSPKDQKTRLLSITEDLGKLQTEQREPRVPAKKERKLRAGNVVGLDVIQGSDSAPGSVVVSYDNGSVDCLSDDLSGARWEHTATSDIHVEFSTVLDSAAARKGLLKGREDILATLNQTSSGTSNHHAIPLLLQVIHSSAHRQIRVSALRNAQGDSIRTHQSPMDELIAYNLSGSDANSDKEFQYEVHAGSGTLYQRIGGRLYIFDLSGTLPRLVAELGNKGTPRVKNFVRLSPSSVLTVGRDGLAVSEIKFGSVLSSLSRPSTEPPLRVISQFTELSIVVAFAGTNLIAFQIGDILDNGRRAKAHEPLLIDALGKGARPDESYSADQLSSKPAKLQKRFDGWKAKVDEAVALHHIEVLEAIVAKDLHLEQVGTTAEKNTADAIVDNANAAENEVWELPPHTYDAQNVSSAKASYLLGALFTRSESVELSKKSAPHLKLKMVPGNILRWLTLAGYMTHIHIERSLRSRNKDLTSKLQVAPGEVMAALAEADASFTTMCELLSLPVHWDLLETVRALQLLIRSFEDRDRTPPAGLITGSSNEDDENMANGNHETLLQAEVDAASKELDEAQSMFDNGATIRSRACQILFARLHALPQAGVVRAMRAMLSQEDLIFFLAILRTELRQAGWTQTYVEAEQAAAEQEFPMGSLDNAPDLEPSNHAIRTIADLCSYAIDAIGLSGWVVGLSGDIDGTSSLIAETRNEISAAAEGLLGVEVVDTMLREIIKMAGSVQGDLKRKRDIESALPMGGRAQKPRRITGGFNKQAAAEERSRGVGKYSFEQIRL